MDEYFNIGCSTEFGLCHIGLYQPLMNRFLLTLGDVHQAREIALIASNRYHLFLVNLTSADNYSSNLIDNQCCENWALLNSQTKETRIHNYANFIVDADYLVQCFDQSVGFVHSDIQEEKKYLQLVWYYLKLLDQMLEINIPGWRIKKLMSDTFDLEDQKFLIAQNLKKQIMSKMFSTRATDSIKADLEHIISNAKNCYDFVF